MICSCFRKSILDGQQSFQVGASWTDLGCSLFRRLILDKFTCLMQSLSIYARLFARALGGTEAESILLNSLLRLSSTTPSAITYSSNRLAITYPSAALQRTVHLVTASSGYSGHHSDKTECLTQSRQRTSSLLESKSNVFGDDAFFVAKHRLGDFLGRWCRRRRDSFSLSIFRCRWRCWELARTRHRPIIVFQFINERLQISDRQ